MTWAISSSTASRWCLPQVCGTDFGFCVCRDSHEEKKLRDIYRRIFQLHSLRDFWTICSRGVLSTIVEPLLSTFQLRRREELLDVLRVSLPGGNAKAVWPLKGFILSHYDAVIMGDPAIPISTPYGFCNVGSVADVKELKRLYRRLLFDANVRPLRLHEAADEGRIYDFADSILRFGKRERELFRVLLRSDPAGPAV